MKIFMIIAAILDVIMLLLIIPIIKYMSNKNIKTSDFLAGILTLGMIAMSLVSSVPFVILYFTENLN